MGNTFRIELNDLDLGHLLEGLRTRSESWERTAEYLRTETMSEGEFFVVEECSKPEEVDNIPEHHCSITQTFESQMGAKS
jgi:hypothetical protein